MEFAKLSAPSLKDLFVQQLQGMILSGALPVGTQLPPERVLAEQMQVSRTVVNSGLAELSGQGFLEVRPRQGTCVADYRRRGNLSTLIAIMQYKGGALGKEEIRSILEVRRALEHLAAERAILYASDQALDGAGLAVAFVVLLAFILLGIVFDIIGVSVTAADEKPFHSMAARKTPGAREALNLIRKADKVSSFCNDVVGDICGIISGSTGAVIVVQMQAAFGFLPVVVLSLAVTALTSGLTIGGKALGKSFAIAKSTAVLQLVGRFLHLFSRKKR